MSGLLNTSQMHALWDLPYEHEAHFIGSLCL